MVEQERIIEWYVNNHVPKKESGPCAIFLDTLENNPEYIQEKIFEKVPEILDLASKHFQEGLEVVNLDFNQFAIEVVNRFRKVFLN